MTSIHIEETETGTAKLLRRALNYERHVKAACRKTDYARKATTDQERIRWLEAARDDINGALAAMGEDRE